jgi:hypothetical protein
MFEWHNNGRCMNTFEASRNRTVAVNFLKLFVNACCFVVVAYIGMFALER